MTSPAGTGRTALVVDDDEMVAELVRAGLESAGLTVVTAADGHEALDRLAEAVPDVVVSDVNMPGMDGFALVSRLRAEPATRRVPLVFLSSRSQRDDVLTGLRLGADDYVRKPFDLDELVGRVLAKVARPPVPVDELVHDVRTGLLSPARVLEEIDREAVRGRRTGRPAAVAVLDVAERGMLRSRFGPRGDDELALQVTARLAPDAGPLEQVGRDSAGRFVVLMPETDEDATRARLDELSARMAGDRLTVAGDRVQVTPVIGWTALGPEPAQVLLDRAALAADAAWSHLDLRPVRWTPDLEATARSERGRHRAGPRLRARLRTPLQVVLTLVLGVVLPFFVHLGLHAVGVDISGVTYPIVVVALVVTAASIWAEGLLALRPDQPPEEPAAPYPRASAVIAAYLPNEAATVVETVESFLRLDYPGELQVILAYNTPRPLPVEETLADLARKDPRLVPFKVLDSTSKAQNVNAALAEVTGEFVGVFDADHHPDPGSYRRAWRWLSHGYDVVQGHCVIRNGDASWMARTIAVEFESIYAVSHPGRARLHRFGIFGGSNGYWRTDLLRRIRMHGSMLTEDIDSSLRVVEAGGRIASDPHLVSRELGPTTLKAVWNQRMRWAQGWFQVSMKHLPLAWRSPALSLRQKLGMSFLLGWREVYPWISLQMIPIIAFLAWRDGGLGRLDWLVPLFVLTTLFTASVGPGQAFFARKLAVPEIRRQRWWFLRYLVVSSFFYTEFKNVIARVAQLKEFSGEREWKVTPRAAPAASEKSAS
ncbi:response regulator [Geodermatophilus obscurus]|uniref:Response regulator receiver modulated diguanylate cyclase n=1 Tax=Geodermatophilus obscurus (strain ATCC 25078 / DSM 43160 / JCM 3152 / CCUG 61914 / KCC A-0152 / KCTC 9177 / NBRC 13315 / NRRL B-3577 / G-20) TaxID=526225 RepID=D2SC76_GEOOG|nr:response regulator [Geodermatophilus obscurus]ADB74244.1 response regulator receiver modulated diguanylate cyclase [Geodermatophilus obscurus DSM 43160]